MHRQIGDQMKKRKISLQLPKDALSNLFKKAATQRYPEQPADVAENFRGKQILNIENCIGCTLCARDCPAQAIDFVMVDGKKRPRIHLDRCVFCYQCADTCPRNVFQKSKVFELATTEKSTLVMQPPQSTVKSEQATAAPSASENKPPS